jgi:hypothetical protein
MANEMNFRFPLSIRGGLGCSLGSWCWPRLVVLLLAIMSAPPPTPAPSPSPSAHPDRRAPAKQPVPVERPTASAGSRWAVQADVERRGTGKAKGTWIVERSPKIYAPTEEAAVLKQQEWINDYLHPKVRAA